MAEQADAPEREDEELQLQDQNDEGGDAQDDQDQQDGSDASDQDDDQDEGGDADDEGDEFEISFGDEAAPASQGSNSDLVKHLRQVNRDQAEKLAKFERGEIPAQQPQKIEAGPKPTLESCDWDEAKFEAELDTWKEQKRQAEQADAQVAQQAQAAQEKFTSRLLAYDAGKKALGARDFEVVESAVLAGLSQVQQAAIVQAADDPAKLVYALGRHPEKLKVLAATQDPIEFIKATVKLEGQLKVTQRGRTPPDPDRPVRGSAPLSDKRDRTLERLEKEAERSGDRTAVVKYKRQLKAQGRS